MWTDMRNLILYFLTSIFVLFMVVNKLNVQSFPNDNLGHVSHGILKKANIQKQSSNQSISSVISDGDKGVNLEIEEDDFNISDTLESILFFSCVFGLICIFRLSIDRLKVNFKHSHLAHLLSARKFIVLRTLRI